MLSTFSKWGRDVWNFVPIEIKQTHALNLLNFYTRNICYNYNFINYLNKSTHKHYFWYWLISFQTLFCIVLFIWLCLKVNPKYELIIIIIYTWLSVCHYLIKCIPLFFLFLFSVMIVCMREWIDIMLCRNVLLKICTFVYYWNVVLICWRPYLSVKKCASVLELRLGLK